MNCATIVYIVLSDAWDSFRTVHPLPGDYCVLIGVPSIPCCYRITTERFASAKEHMEWSINAMFAEPSRP